jgi:DNA-binding Lrp family transcriptional regulator
VILQSPVRDKILTWLEANGPAEPREVALGLGITRTVAGHRMRDLLDLGQLSRSARGYECRPSTVRVVPAEDNGDGGDSGDGTTADPYIVPPVRVVADEDDTDSGVPTSSHVRHVS